MTVQERKGRKYEIEAFNRFLGHPCRRCGETLTVDNQSWGWRGTCKPCRSILRKGESCCLICGGSFDSLSNNRCAVCFDIYQSNS